MTEQTHIADASPQRHDELGLRQAEAPWRAVEEVLLLQGLPADVAAVWQDWWLPGQSILRVISDAEAYVASGVPVERAVVWHRVGCGSDVGIRLHRIGWTPADGLQVRLKISRWAELQPWLDTGLRPSEIIRYACAGVVPSEVGTFAATDDQAAVLRLLTGLRSDAKV